MKTNFILGLSSLAKNATYSAEYLFKLIDSVMVKIPLKKYHDIPLYIMATAGMRLVSHMEQEAILKDIRHDIAMRYPQLFFPASHIQIISGKMEAVYAWIAMNYILGNFDKHAKSTVGILEMGGASLQIAYEVPHNYSTFVYKNSKNTSKEQVNEIVANSIYQLNLSGRIPNGAIKKKKYYDVYVKSFLGFGVNQTIDIYKKSVMLKYLQILKNKNKTSGDSVQIQDPCYPVGYTYKLRVDNSVHNNTTNKINITGTGNFKSCHKSLIPLLKLNSECSLEPCSLDGVHHPIGFYAQLPNHTLLPKFYGISEFLYSHAILELNDIYNSKAFKDKAVRYCATPYNPILKAYKKHLLLNVNSAYGKNSIINQCIKAVWIYTVLHDGFEFPKDQDILESVDLVKGKEVSWTLGAIIHTILYDLS
ncbi:unnamed protein product [Gordionus sp. m RMFG-2023]